MRIYTRTSVWSTRNWNPIFSPSYHSRSYPTTPNLTLPPTTLPSYRTHDNTASANSRIHTAFLLTTLLIGVAGGGVWGGGGGAGAHVGVAAGGRGGGGGCGWSAIQHRCVDREEVPGLAVGAGQSASQAPRNQSIISY